MHPYLRRPAQKWALSLADPIHSLTIMLLSSCILVIRRNNPLVRNNSSQINKVNHTIYILIRILYLNSILDTRKA